MDLPEREPWPNPVDGKALIDGIVDQLLRYFVMTDEEALATALWVVHCHAHDWFAVSPRLHLSSPEKQCGKSTLLRVIECMAPRPLPTENITPAALFRTIEMARPTLLVDEADTFLGADEALRGLLNAGHTRNGSVIRTVGDDHEPRLFSVWCAVAIAGIGRIPDTLADRSVQIRLQRRLKDEHVERLRLDRREHLYDLGRKIARWIADNELRIKSCDPALPDGLSDRGQDNWRPLIAIADIIGGNWSANARDAADAISNSSRQDDPSAAIMLLHDVLQVFEDTQQDKVPSADIVSKLIEMEDRPWRV